MPRLLLILAAILFLAWPGPCRAQSLRNPADTPGQWARENLGPAQNAWLKEHPVIRMGVGAAYVPVMYQEPDALGRPVFKGMVSDYTKLLARRLGVELRPVLGIKFKDALARGRERAIDLFPCLVKTKEREQYLTYTKPYLSFPLVIVTRKDFPFVTGLGDFRGRSLAKVEGLAYARRLKREFPEIRIYPLDTIPQALEAVSLGRADGYVTNLAVASYYIHRLGMANLKVAAPTAFNNNELAMAVRSDWPQLAAILQKALDSITPQERDRIQQHWIAVRYEYGMRWGQMAWVGGAVSLGLLLLVLIFVLWNKRLAREVKEREQAQKALAESELRYRHIFNSMLDGLVISSAEGVVLEANPAALLMHGYSSEEVVGQQVLNLVAPERHGQMRQFLQQALASGSFHGISKGKRKDGGLMDVEVRGSIIEISGTGYLMAILRDITKRRQAEKSLRRSEERHRTLFEASPSPLFMQDFSAVMARVEGLKESGVKDLKPFLLENPRIVDELVSLVKVSEANQAAMDLYQAKSARELMSALGRCLIKDDREHFVGQLAAFARGDTWYQGEARNLTLKGEVIDIIVRKAVVPGSGLSRVLVALTDVTQLNRAHDERERLEAQLRHAQKMEAVGILAGGVAHDFNNVLQTISGYADFLEDDPSLRGGARDSIGNIQKAVQRASSLIKRLMTFSRKIEPCLSAVDLNREVAQVADILKRTIPPMITIETRLDADIGQIKGDAVQIEQVLLNLGSNAADAMPSGGGLVIETSQVTLGEAFAAMTTDMKPGDYVRLRVRDNGQGMDAKTKEHIFDPFFTTKEVGRGTGLGLSTVFGIVKSHGGRITCDSAPGRGTCFDIFLPVLEGAGRSEDDDLSIYLDRGSETVLVVDDEPGIREVTSRYLSTRGYQVHQASSGEMALEIFGREGDIDMVVLDLGMPGMGGRQTLHELLKLDPDVKVIITSGYADQAAAGDELSGAAGFLAKPYNLSQLQEALARALAA